MFSRIKTAEPHELDDSITNLISEIAGLDAGSEDYTAAATSLKVLMDARNSDREFAKPDTMSYDAIASIAGSLLGIALILGFEKANVLTTKSLAFVPKITV
ncbi:MAG TPA: hypothetical protein VGI71_23795 [Scandinavium sp.]